MGTDRGSVILYVIWWTLVTSRLVIAGLSCLSNPCLHGICIDDINSTYSCYCVDGYTGVQCQTNWDECWSYPCLNGGTCIDGIASYNCSCPEGFIGDNCETNFNECESNPCSNNGTCIDMTNGYVCSCVPGYSGQHCELDVAVCNSTEEVRCYNGGHCIEGPGFKFYCKCLPGWTGSKCEEQIDECESNPCQNGGVCIDVHADYMCACAFGFTGKSCETQIEFCDDNSCSNDALCVVEDGMRVCYCVPDYHGERCELQYDECLLGPRCMNGGSCIDGVDNFTCSCPPRLTGSLCECLILDDETYDCNYVSPTPLPYITESLSTTPQGIFTTDGFTFTDLNDTSLRISTSTNYYDTEAWTSSTLSEIPSTVYTEIDITSPTQDIAISSNTVPQEIPSETTNFSNPEEETMLTLLTETVTVTDTATPEITTDCDENNSSCINFDISTTVSTAPKLGTSTEMTTVATETGFPLIIANMTTEISHITTEFVTVLATEIASVRTVSSEEPTAVVTIPAKGDITTEKMFTDTPSEHLLTEYTTPNVYTTTESMDTTLAVDNSTLVYTTLQSECTGSICNNHGTCMTSPHGIRCHCNFNYAGRFCEDQIVIKSAAFGGKSYIAHKLRNSSSIDIMFNAKTLITDGQIMHVDIAKDVYMQLYMMSGLLKFKFSCGYQTMLLSELKTFVNKGYMMKIETRLDLYIEEQHCNATLRLNDTLAMSGGQVANFSSLDPNTTLYLGNAPDRSGGKPFIGCVSDLSVNSEARQIFGDAIEGAEVSECSSLACLSGPCSNGGSCSDRGSGYTCSCTNGWSGEHCNVSVCENNPCQSGGSCVRHPGSGFLCLCPYGKHGIFCDYNVDITIPSLAPINTGVSSYLMYPLSASAVSTDRFDLRLRFQTSDLDQIALLAFIGQTGAHDSRSQHLAVTFVKGYIMLTWNMGSGPRRVFTSRALGARRGGHTVRVWRRGRSAGLTVDSRFNVSGNAPAHDTKMTTLPYVFIGGHPSKGFHNLPHDLPLHNGWRGCIWEVGGGSVEERPIGGRGVGQCGVAHCTAKACHAPRGVCVHSPATYGCICNEGWFGATCSSTSNPCDANATQCRGRCVYTTEDSECDCPYGKSGANCDEDLLPTDVLFTGKRSFIELIPQTISSVSVSFEAEVKPSKERGLLLYTETPHFYTSLSLQGGLLEYRWTDRLSGVTSLVRSGVVLSLRQWHAVRAGRYGSRLYVWVDGALTTSALRAHAYPHTSALATVLLGGAQDLSSLPFDVMSGAPEPFTGCIRNLHINNILLPLVQQNIQKGQNVADCDGTACGAESCPGGSCVLENGRARCVCGVGGSGGGSIPGGGGSVPDGGGSIPGGGGSTPGGGDSGGARCRRHAGCSQATCVPPAGRCRRGSCVCATGYAGVDCEQYINITIPQFFGDSLLSLTKRSPGEKLTGEQRVASGQRPGYISLNFTTAEPDGLLLWIVMDTDYLGIGLDEGFLKLVWSFSNSTQAGTKIVKPGSSRLVPHAGFLADAEWHLLVVRLERTNITLTVDQGLAYMEEPGLRGGTDYDNVDIFIGGMNKEDSTTAKKMFPRNFKGCIDQIATKEDTLLRNYTNIYSENIKSCQLFPI